ncbi:MAG: methionine--tRNA ligase subunit beta, partial [Clostridia bacterium]|nr:methionine--tRNA ligase subunit beta [Clostridia bacterium]
GYGNLQVGATVCKGECLCPRVDIAKECCALEEIVKASMPAPKEEEKKIEHKQQISIDDFDKIELRAAKVIACEAVPKANKLLKLRVSLGGGEERTVVSGIAKFYTPEEMVGKTVTLVCNLAPCVLRGILSEGMILCAEDSEGKLTLVQPTAPEGSEIC